MTTRDQLRRLQVEPEPRRVAGPPLWYSLLMLSIGGVIMLGFVWLLIYKWGWIGALCAALFLAVLVVIGYLLAVASEIDDAAERERWL